MMHIKYRKPLRDRDDVLMSKAIEQQDQALPALQNPALVMEWVKSNVGLIHLVCA